MPPRRGWDFFWDWFFYKDFAPMVLGFSLQRAAP
jgi:hypothetical protein